MDALEVKVKQLEEEINAIKQESSKSHEKIYDRLRDLEKESAVSAERYKNILNELSSQKSQLSTIVASIEELGKKPAKRWDSAVSNLVSAVIGAIVAFAGKSIFGG